MRIINYEFKARVENLEMYEQKLLELQPVFKGTDHQVDTYFKVSKGRLKLREGNIENALIQYERENTADAKKSEIVLYKHLPHPALKDILIQQFGIKTVVDKKRKIYFIENIKFHFDEVKGLGTFIEVEAIDEDGSFSIEDLQSQCNRYKDFFGLEPLQLMEKSYSDMLMEKQEENNS